MEYPLQYARCAKWEWDEKEKGGIGCGIFRAVFYRCDLLMRVRRRKKKWFEIPKNPNSNTEHKKKNFRQSPLDLSVRPFVQSLLESVFLYGTQETQDCWTVNFMSALDPWCAKKTPIDFLFSGNDTNVTQENATVYPRKPPKK